MADAAVPTKPARVLSQNFGAFEFKRNRWFYELTEAQTPDDLLRPEFFADIVDKVRGHAMSNGVGDRIEFDKPDTGWAGTARIDAIGQGYMKIRIFEECRPIEAVIPEGALTTRWNVGARRHEVIRTSSKDVVATGFQTKADAAAWIASHLKDMAA